MKTTVDAFLGGRFHLEQPAKGQRAGVDAMLLAAAVPCVEGQPQRLLDAGAGTAPVALAVAARCRAVSVTAIEQQQEIAALAQKNVERNEVADRVKVIVGDLTRPLRELEGLGLQVQSFDHVAANPPFYSVGRSRPCATVEKSRAHQLGEGDLAEWVRFLTAMARPKGSLSLIHLPESLPDILELLQGRFGALKIAPIHSRPHGSAIRVLVQGIKGSRAPLSLLPGLVLRGEDDVYTRRTDNFLRDGAPWRL